MRKKLLSLLLCILLLTTGTTAQALVQRHPLLDEAFRLLEKDNIFQRRYNEYTGANIESLFELGIPYFFGGSGMWLTESWPNYRQFSPWQNSVDYKMDSVYLMGLDCSGFTAYIFERVGFAPHGSLSNIMTKAEYRPRQLFSHRKGEEVPADPGRLKYTLRVGDLLVVAHPTWHVMMYIGTLEDYGFTAEDLPDAAEYLNYPLVIHSSGNPHLREVFNNLIMEREDLYGGCLPPSGGVAVSILGVPVESVEKLGNVNAMHYFGFELDDGRYPLYLWTPKQPEYYCWYRAPELMQ